MENENIITMENTDVTTDEETYIPEIIVTNDESNKNVAFAAAIGFGAGLAAPFIAYGAVKLGRAIKAKKEAKKLAAIAKFNDIAEDADPYEDEETED